jgi:photosynthetic reaction center H subunit
MENDVSLLSRIDVVEVLLYLFFGFFAALILYLLREGRREGFPLEADETGRLESLPILDHGSAKEFALPHGTGSVFKPDYVRDSQPFNAARTAPWAGAPYTPLGDPLADGVGPAAWANRADVPDPMHDGSPKIVPLSAAPGFAVTKEDRDPRGWTVTGHDGAVAGTVVELWVDRMESLVRYLEVRLPDGSRTVLLPMMMSTINATKGAVETDSITAAQFAGAPAIKSATSITLLEEEKVAGYFGGGYLYATPDRLDPLA